MQAAPPPHLVPVDATGEVKQAEYDDEISAAAPDDKGASASMALVDDAESDSSSEGEPDRINSKAASLLSDQDLNLESAPGLLSYFSMDAATIKALADLLVKIAMIVLFAAGLIRTSLPSLFYAAFSVQALYCSRVGLKSMFPDALLVCTTAIGIAMIIIHIAVNQSSAVFSPLLLQVPMHTPVSQSPYVYVLNFRFSCSAPA
jgi:hypothetical protein